MALPAAGVPAERFTVQPGDVLRIRVWPDTTLGGDYGIEDTGLVYLPVVGALEVGGRSLADVRTLLRDEYRDALKVPIVTVTPVFPVSVLGAVERPGLYHVTPSETLLDVITMAGGFAPNARQSSLRIIRGGEVMRMDAKEWMERGAPELALTLQSRDRVVVPAKRFQIGARDVLLALQSIGIIITLTDRLWN